MTENDFDPDKLSERAVRFCEEFCVDFCKTKAELRSGYLPGSGPSLNDPRIVKKIEENKARHAARVNISVDWVLEGLRRIAEGSPTDFLEIAVNADGVNYVKLAMHKAAPEQLKNIKKIKQGKYGLEFEMYDALSARMKIGQYLKMFNANEEQAVAGEQTPDTYEIVFHAPQLDQPTPEPLNEGDGNGLQNDRIGN